MEDVWTAIAAHNFSYSEANATIEQVSILANELVRNSPSFPGGSIYSYGSWVGDVILSSIVGMLSFAVKF